MVPSTHATLLGTSTFLGMFREKIWSGPEKSKNVPKQPKLKVIIHTFGLFSGPSYGRPEMPLRDIGGH